MKKLSKKAKIIIAAALAVVVIAAVVLTLFLTGVIGDSKVGSLSDEKYETVGIDFVSMTQKGSSTYDLNITLEDKFASESNVKIYFSKNDTFDEEKSDELNYTKLDDGTYEIDGIIYESGDYFLYVTAGDEVGTYPITIPTMSPKTWMNNETVNIEFEIDSDTSWSSFIDAEGKNVYRSASTTFDDTARAMEENIDILTSSYSDASPSAEEPYYYLVLNGKNGTFRYISSPLFYNATQGDVEVSFYEEDDEPYLEITGTLYSLSEDAERVMQLRVGNYDGDDPTSTFTVDNSYTGKDKTAFEFKIPLEDLKESSNNLTLFLTENGTTCEWSINAKNLDLSSYSLSSGNAQYGLTDEEALKITRMIDAYDDISVSIGKSNGKAVLKVDGTLKYGVGGEDYQLVLTASDGQQYVAENEVDEDKRFSFTFPLKQLYSSGVWYDIQVKCVEEVEYYDMASSVADLDESVTVGERKYNFEEYGGLLKIQYTVVKNFSGLTATLTNENGNPTLTVSGTIKKTQADNLSLAIRTGETVITAANTATTDGEFQASIDLSQMTEKETWYDVLIYYADNDAYYDMATSNADMDSQLESGSYIYTFQDWEDQLKVQYADAPVEINNQKAVINETDNGAVLVITGTAAEDASDYKLGIRNEDNLITTVSNQASKNKVKFSVNLSQLPKSGTWYDIIVGHSGFSDAADISTDAADMDTSVTYSSHIYKFADWEGQLKVYYDNSPKDIKGVSAKIKEIDGKAYLIVKGKMSNASNRYLGIRTGDKIITVKNTGEDNKIYFKFDLSKLSSEKTWYDIVIGTYGSDSYRDVTVSSADMDQTLTTKKRVYSFQEWENALKITYSKVAKDLKNVKVSITEKSGKPVLKVTGTMKNASSMYLGIRTKDTVYKVKNKGKGNKLSFTFDLTKLDSEGTWYDVIIGNKSFTTYKDVTVASADMSKTATYKKKTYKLAEWNNELKVYYESDSSGLAKGQSIKSVKATLILKNGKPVLRVQGTMKKIECSNLRLAIRTDDDVIKVSNNTTTSGRFSFDFNLTKLTSVGIWYDVLLYEKESGTYIDVTTDAVYSTDVSVSYKENVYRFADWAGDLKVYYTNTAEEEAAEKEAAESFTNVSAKITSSGGKPVLSVAADIGSLSKDDVTLRVRSGDTVVTATNTASGSGKFSGTIDLTKLETKGTWYDVYWYVESTGVEVNLTEDNADMDSNCTYNGSTYQFKEWNSQLKVEFE